MKTLLTAMRKEIFIIACVLAGILIVITPVYADKAWNPLLPSAWQAGLGCEGLIINLHAPGWRFDPTTVKDSSCLNGFIHKRTKNVFKEFYNVIIKKKRMPKAQTAIRDVVVVGNAVKGPDCWFTFINEQGTKARDRFKQNFCYWRRGKIIVSAPSGKKPHHVGYGGSVGFATGDGLAPLYVDRGDFTELYAGMRIFAAPYEISGNMGNMAMQTAVPYVAAGVTFLQARLEDNFGVSDTDSTLGLYVRAGMTMGEFFAVEGRYTLGFNRDLFGKDLDLSGAQASVWIRFDAFLFLMMFLDHH